MTHRVLWTKRATRELDDLPRDTQARILGAVGGLQANPRPPGCKKLRGMLALYRIRAGDFRIIYTVDDGERVVVVTTVGDRKDVY